jgi:tetratricopeptide (TPR) repeat protein
MVSWLGPQTEPLIENTAALSINCHGCQCFSRYAPRKNSKLLVQAADNNTDTKNPVAQHPARVAWARRSKRMAGLYLVGVEFEAAQNLWNVEDPPVDWISFPSSTQEYPGSLLADVERLLCLVRKGTHYQLMDLQPNLDPSELKRRYYQLARRFHPDRHMDHPEWALHLQLLMDALATAYKVLSSDDSKSRYDAEVLPSPEQERPKQWTLEYLEKAQQCLAEKNFIGAILWLRRAIESNPRCSSYRAMLAECLAQFPEYRREAIEQFEKAIELDPRSVMAHLRYAQMLEHVRMPWQARPHYVQVLELDMNHQEARERLNLLDAAAPRHASRSTLLGRLKGRLSR